MHDVNSPLRSGSMTRHAESIMIPGLQTDERARAEMDRDKVRQVALKMLNASLAHAFEAWVDGTRCKRQARHVCKRVVMRTRSRTLVHAFDRFHSQVEEYKTMKSVCRKVVLRMRSQTLANSFGRFHDQVEESKTMKSVCSRVMIRMRSQTLTNAFDRFYSQVEESKETKRKLAQVLSKWTNSALRLGWDGWLEGIEVQADERARTEMLGDHYRVPSQPALHARWSRTEVASVVLAAWRARVHSRTKKMDMAACVITYWTRSKCWRLFANWAMASKALRTRKKSMAAVFDNARAERVRNGSRTRAHSEPPLTFSTRGKLFQGLERVFKLRVDSYVHELKAQCRSAKMWYEDHAQRYMSAHERGLGGGVLTGHLFDHR